MRFHLQELVAHHDRAFRLTPVHPESLDQAWLNGRHRVLGRRLRPFCLWHRFALDALHSPFAQPDGEPRLGDLEVAVRICRSRYPETDGAAFAEMLARKVSRLRRLELRWLCPGGKWQGEGAKFAHYVREFQRVPKLWQAAGEKAGTGEAPPETISVASQLITAGFSEARAWDMPVGRAYWYAAVFARQAGNEVKFMCESDETLQGIKRLQAMHAAGKLKFTAEGVHYEL